jgi:hypothetical protein
MTSAQETYLKNLCAAANEPIPGGKLSNVEATKIIDRLKDKTGIGDSTG